MKQYLMIIKVKPECREEYIAVHKDPWREMLLAIREAGFRNETIWYFEDQSIIYLECEDHDACNARLRATEICKRWDMEMLPRFAAEPVMPEEIFNLNEMLDKEQANRKERVYASPAANRDAKREDDKMERQAIEAVIRRFFDASYAADPVKMETVFHDGFQFFGFNGEGGLVKKTKAEFVEGYRVNRADPSWPDYPRVNEIVSIDFTGENTAVARTKIRIRSTLYTDIFCFMRLAGEWRIISKVAAGVPIE